MVRRRSSRCLYKDFVFSNETVLQSSMQQHKPNQNPFLRTALQCHAAIRQSPRKTNFPFQQSFAFSTSYPWTPYASSQVHWPARSHDKASVWIQLLTRFLTKAPHRNWASQHQCQTRLGSSVGMRRTSRLESSWFSSFLIVLLAATQTNVDDCRGPAFPVKSLIISLEDTELLGPLQIQQLWAGSSILKLYKTNKSTWNPPIQPRKQPMFHTWSTTALSFRPLRFEPLLPPDSPGGRVKFPNGNVPRCAMNAFLVKSYHIFKVFDSKDRWKIFRIWFASIWEKHSHKHWTILNPLSSKGPPKKNRVVTWLPPSDGDSGGDDGVEALGFCNRPASPLTYHPCVSDSPEKRNLVTWLPRIAKTLTKKIGKPSSLQLPGIQTPARELADSPVRTASDSNSSDFPPKKKKRHLWSTWIIFFFCHFHVQTFPNFPTNLELCLPFEPSWPYHTGPDHP